MTFLIQNDRREEDTAITPRHQLPHITAEELEAVPKYTRGRLTLQKMNESIDVLNGICADKYRILTTPASKLNNKTTKQYWKYKEADSHPEVKGMYFITEADLRGVPLPKGFIAILRHLGMMKEVRGGGFTRLVFL